MVLQDWIGPRLNLVLGGYELDEVYEFSYLVSHIPPSGRISDEMSSRMQKARLESTALRRVWR